MALNPGTTLGSYSVTAKIGEGGMGEVYGVRRMSNHTSVRALVFALSLSFLVGIPNSYCDPEVLAAGAAQTDGSGHVFTYSVIQVTSDRNAVLAQLETAVIPMMVREGATPYSVWLPVELDGDVARDMDRFGRGFAGLSDAELGLMLAWPEAAVDLDALDDTLSTLGGVGAVTTRAFDPLYLSDGLRVPTGRGFYVHREERYRLEDAPEAVRLSQAAWETWEPAWGTVVTGLYRERGEPADVARLLRIVWYPDFQRWVETREFDREPESVPFFRARGELQLEGSGVAIATDRVAP